MPHPSTEKIWQIASFDKEIRSKVALELLCSWPAPAIRNGTSGFWFFYYASFGPPPAKEFKLYPPSWVVWILSSNGTWRDLARIHPKDVGLNAKQGEPFAAYTWPETLTYQTAETKRAQLFDAYDRVLELWGAKKSKVSPAEVRSMDDFNKLFMELTPLALLPCYKYLAPEFFSWAKF